MRSLALLREKNTAPQGLRQERHALPRIVKNTQHVQNIHTAPQGLRQER